MVRLNLSSQIVLNKIPQELYNPKNIPTFTSPLKKVPKALPMPSRQPFATKKKKESSASWPWEQAHRSVPFTTSW